MTALMSFKLEEGANVSERTISAPENMYELLFYSYLSVLSDCKNQSRFTSEWPTP